MKNEKLLQAIGEIDDELVYGAVNDTKVKKNTWIRLGVVAACLCLIAVGAMIWRKPSAPVKEDSGIILSENGVTIPKMDVSLSAEEAADMLAFFIYQGNCYVQYEWVEDSDILGEYLGTATGLIDEWTPKDGYVDFAGSVKGDFFSVKGYAPSFMLCMKYANGEVSTYVCDNGITLKYGSELYEDRLHLSDNYRAVQYETRDSWNYSKNEFYRMNGNDELIRSFIDELDKAEFIPWDDAAALEGQTASSMIDDKEIYHMYFMMANGTTVHLRLYENGYVRFQGLLDVCVQIPKDSFDPLIEAMKNHIAAEPVAVTNPIKEKFEKCKNDPELGGYIPAYEVPGSTLLISEVYYDLEPGTGAEKGTKEIYIEYTSVNDSNLYYSVTITWNDEYGKNGWAGPMIDISELSVEALTEYEHVRESTGVTKIDIGVRYDNVSVILSASGMDAEEAFKIFESVRY